MGIRPAISSRVLTFLWALSSLAGSALAKDEPPIASRLSDKPVPLETLPDRPKPLVELGDPFFGTGPLQDGFTLPGGAVWRPSFLAFGTLQTVVDTFDDGRGRSSEWANRLDVFGNLQLTQTERILVGFRPIDDRRRFLGSELEPDVDFRDPTNGDVDVLFAEGNLRELVPALDPGDSRRLSYAFAVGRQPILLQNGILMNDIVDAVGISRTTLTTPWTPSLRWTALYGWSEVHRDDNRRDDSARLFALSTSADFPETTLEVDGVYVRSDERAGAGDGLYGGLGAVERLHPFGTTVSTTLRVTGSAAIDEETPAVGDGVLLFAEAGRTPTGTQDWTYVDAFWGIDRFSSAARGPDREGPLGRTGILFEAFEVGTFGAALGNRAEDSAGGAVGYQKLWVPLRRQLVVEVGGRSETRGRNQAAAAAGARFQQAFRQRWLFECAGFVAAAEERRRPYGVRAGVVLKF